MTQNGLTDSQMRDILCAPEATDSIGDIDFDPDRNFDTDADRRFAEDYIRAWMKRRGTLEKRR
jgi:hypothetical protein